MKQKFLLPWIPLWVVPLLAALAIGTVWLRLSIVRTTYRISQTDRLNRKLEQRKEQAEVRVTALRSPRRLETIARRRYGLSQPSAEQMIHLAAHVPFRKSWSTGRAQ